MGLRARAHHWGPGAGLESAASLANGGSKGFWLVALCCVVISGVCWLSSETRDADQFEKHQARR